LTLAKGVDTKRRPVFVIAVISSHVPPNKTYDIPHKIPQIIKPKYLVHK